MGGDQRVAGIGVAIGLLIASIWGGPGVWVASLAVVGLWVYRTGKSIYTKCAEWCRNHYLQ